MPSGKCQIEDSSGERKEISDPVTMKDGERGGVNLRKEEADSLSVADRGSLRRRRREEEGPGCTADLVTPGHDKQGHRRAEGRQSTS